MVDTARLGELAALADGELIGDPDASVLDVTHDSRRVAPGWMFAAVRGFITDGHQFVRDAAAAGASAVCVDDRDVIPDGIAAIVVDDVRSRLGTIAAAVHGHPSRSLRLIGVTGTNGKTTTTHLIESIAAAAGIQQAIIGTVGARINGTPFPVERTTPEATDFQRLLATMAGLGVSLAAVEVSSHALELGRVDGAEFAVGAFTNLSQDHLDFHADMGEYFAAKRRLFERVDTTVSWIEDPAGRVVADESPGPVVRVGFGADADVQGTPVALTIGGSTFDATGPGGGARIHLPLPGRFNMANALVAAACANVLGIAWDTIADGIGRMVSPPGRFEVVPTAHECTVVVDYAHTPEGIASVIGAARELAGEGRIIAVAGAAGDRDPAKRPLMGAAASTADITVLTSDNPRSEDPEAILAEVMAGAGDHAVAEVDRRRAIRIALDRAAPGDVVLILGKGHEQTQEVGGELRPFDDRLVAREVAAT